MEMLKIQDLWKTYGRGSNRVDALRGLSFSVDQGEMVAIMGPSGSGKSTLLNIIGGLIPASSGQVIVSGMKISGRTQNQMTVFRRRNIGIVHQYYQLIPMLTVEENVALPIQLDSRQVSQQRLDALLDHVGMLEKKKALPGELSGGEQQRVAVARALINTPALVLADEPTGNLDRVNTQSIMELFKRANRDFGQTTLLVTHDEEVALQAQRILIVDDGMLVSDQRSWGR